MASSMTNFILLVVAFAAAFLQPIDAARPKGKAPDRSGEAAADVARAPVAADQEHHLRETLIGHLALLLDGINMDDTSITKAVEEAEVILAPILAASPKNEFGKLDDAAARYVLHRLFMEKHGWHFKIFETPDEALASSTSKSTTSIFGFQGHLPIKVRDLLERQFQRHHGYGSLELSLFSAAVEHEVFKAVPSRLARTYLAKGVNIHSVLSIGRVKEIVDMHMAAYITSFDLSKANTAVAFKLVTDMPLVYDNWRQTRAFFREIEHHHVNKNGEYRFGDISKIVTQIEKRFVHWNQHQCEFLKDNLLAVQTQSSGRVRLEDFYNAYLYNGTEAFVETQEYLRQLGNLDESDPLEPRVIISNYRDGPSSCVAVTSFYQVCCVDECFEFYSKLEQGLGKPEAAPSEILAIIKTLHSPSMESCISVATTLEKRLHQMARANNGVVKLHGPEFAEWMHFVYPSECTQASLFGPARHLTPDEWEAKHPELHMQASPDEIKDYSVTLGEMARSKKSSTAAPKADWDVARSAAWKMEL